MGYARKGGLGSPKKREPIDSHHMYHSKSQTRRVRCHNHDHKVPRAGDIIIYFV